MLQRRGKHTSKNHPYNYAFFLMMSVVIIYIAEGKKMKTLLFGLLITSLLVGTVVAADENDSCVPPVRPSCSDYEDLACQSEWADYYMKLECYLYCITGKPVQRGFILKKDDNKILP